MLFKLISWKNTHRGYVLYTMHIELLIYNLQEWLTIRSKQHHKHTFIITKINWSGQHYSCMESWKFKNFQLNVPAFSALAFDLTLVDSFKSVMSLCLSLSFNSYRRIIILFHFADFLTVFLSIWHSEIYIFPINVGKEFPHWNNRIVVTFGQGCAWKGAQIVLLGADYMECKYGVQKIYSD